MKNEHVLSGLMAKRAELSGQIEYAQTALRQLVLDLDRVDAVIRLFDPDADLQAIKPQAFPPRYSAFQGDMSRIVLGMLREATAPLTTLEITNSVILDRGLDEHDRHAFNMIRKRVQACLRHHHKGGLVRSIAEEQETFKRWVIAR
jgi:hypothetical protein